MRFQIIGWGPLEDEPNPNMSWVTTEEHREEDAGAVLKRWWDQGERMGRNHRRLRDPNRLYIVVPDPMTNFENLMGVFRMVNDEPIRIHHS